ncbi:MAG: nuclear transport factor 2 family protein [Proteobacteria bacterium]|nr:nuclear transport factor 2 family protein [Pseudomonadota bacterium]
MQTALQDNDVASARENELRRLNEEYVRASLEGDVQWFDAHLAHDFVCIESDGSVLFRDDFLRMAALPSGLREYTLDYVDVRFYADVALVRASGSWTNQDNIRGISRYIDVYVYTGDAWKVISAQITRPAPSR